MNQKYNLNNITIIEEGQICRNEQLYFYEHWVQVIFFCLYAAIFMVGVGGNLVVIGVILGNKHMRTTINLYLLNLATSDIVISVFSSSKFWGRWQFLGDMCGLTFLAMNMSVCMSTFTLAAIAVSRYMAVFYPFSTRTNSLTRTALIILCIDLVAFFIALPDAIHYKLSQTVNACIITYRDTWSKQFEKGHKSFMKILQFPIPFTIIVICYTTIMFMLRHRDVGRSMSIEQIQGEVARTKRMNKMLISITIIFVICWFPSRLIQMIDAINYEVMDCWELWKLINTIVHVIAMSSTCYNPFLYGLMNPAFKTEYSKLWSCARIGRRPAERSSQMKSSMVTTTTQVEEETAC